MAKTIIFCADGTWNGPDEPDADHKTGWPTNVFKLYANLAGVETSDPSLSDKERERTVTDHSGVAVQISKYLDGVGDSKNFLVWTLGGTLGAGLITRIVRGYTFISRNYQDGDKIIIVGFSRGAYTARALAGLIAARGLLDARKVDLSDKTKAYRLGAAVWYENRRQAIAQQKPGWLGKFEDFIVDLPGFLAKPPASDLLIPAAIEAVAVWDTVGSLGIPEYNLKFDRIDAFQFADRKLSTDVRLGIHVAAIDEERGDFEPTFWDGPDQRITQVLSPGSHADVGGGHPTTGNESGLSDATLVWMTNQLRPLGVRFSDNPTYKPAPSAAGVAHRPWLQLPWTTLPRKPRSMPEGLYLSKSVIDRLHAGPVAADPSIAPSAYAPTNLEKYLTGSELLPGVKII